MFHISSINFLVFLPFPKCTLLYSEDMQHGQVIEGMLTILNPLQVTGHSFEDSPYFFKENVDKTGLCRG